MKRCSRCGEKVNDNIKTCPQCGFYFFVDLQTFLSDEEEFRQVEEEKRKRKEEKE